MLKRAAWLFVAARLLYAQAATVEGIVVNSLTHTGIPGVVVELTAADAKDPAYRTVTDDAGAFRVAGVAPGKYHAAYDKDRFEPPDENPAGQPFEVAAGATARLTEQLVPLAQLHGRVLDSEGRPVPNIAIDRLSASCRRLLSTAKTDAEGRFTIEDILPGVFVLRASPNHPGIPQNVVRFDDLMKPYAEAAAMRRPLYAPVYYPNSTDRLQASLITVRGGEELSDFEIRMPSVPVYRVRGIVRDEKGRPAPGIDVSLRSADTWYMFGDMPPDAQLLSAPDGTFEFSAVAVGEWQVTAESRRGVFEYLGYAGLSVTRHDLEDIDIRMAAPFSMAGRVERIDGRGSNEPVKSARVQLIPIDRPRDQEPMALSEEKGALRINRIYPGRYRIVSSTRVPGYYLASVRLGNSDVLGQEVVLAPGSPSLRIEFRADGGRVQGVVEKGSAATVVLVPTDPSLLDPAFIRSAQCDPEGRFEFDGLRPGSYYAIAFDRVDFDSLESPGFAGGLAPLAAKVHVEREAMASLDLKLTPWHW